MHREPGPLMGAELDSQLVASVMQSPVAFFLLDPAGGFVSVNDAFCQMSGYTRDEVVHMNPSDFDVPGDEDRAAEARALIASGEITSWRRRRPFHRKDGGVLWVDISGNPVRAADGSVVGMAGHAIDVTAEVTAAAERDRLDAKVRDNERRISASELMARAVDGAPIGQTVLTLAGVLVEVNLAACAVLGYERDELRGNRVQTFLHPEDRAEDSDHLRQLTTGATSSYRMDQRMIRGDGTVIWVRTYRSVVRNPDGTPAWVVSQLIDISAEKEAEQRARAAEADLRFRSEHDHLTGTLSRTSILESLADAVTRSTTDRVAVLYLDVDEFKEINDGLSHAAGDAVLKEVAERLRRALRRSDTLGRIGGDEFVAVLSGVAGHPEATEVARIIRERVAAEPIDVDGESVWVTVSIGVALSDPTFDPESLLQEADSALYAAKHAGRNRWASFDNNMRVATRRRLDLATRIRDGLDRHEFHPWYQPQVSLPDHRLLGYEALARWVQPGATLPASSFIDVAEDRGLVQRIGERIMTAAADVFADRPGTRLSVNASPQEISAPGFDDQIHQLLERAEVAHDRFVIEITENSLMGNAESAKQSLRSLADHGIAIHVDDFGTGYSSLAHLRDFPIAGVKLDQSFTRRLGAVPDQNVMAIAAGIADLADRLGMERIAEGIETPEQEENLIDLGWDRGQGHLYARADPQPTAPV